MTSIGLPKSMIGATLGSYSFIIPKIVLENELDNVTHWHDEADPSMISLGPAVVSLVRHCRFLDVPCSATLLKGKRKHDRPNSGDIVTFIEVMAKTLR